MIRRVHPENCGEPVPPSEPAPPPAAGPGSESVGGPSGIVLALTGILLVLAWLIVCLVLRRVF